MTASTWMKQQLLALISKTYKWVVRAYRNLGEGFCKDINDGKTGTLHKILCCLTEERHHTDRKSKTWSLEIDNAKLIIHARGVTCFQHTRDETARKLHSLIRDSPYSICGSGSTSLSNVNRLRCSNTLKSEASLSFNLRNHVLFLPVKKHDRDTSISCNKQAQSNNESMTYIWYCQFNQFMMQNWMTTIDVKEFIITSSSSSPRPMDVSLRITRRFTLNN